MKSPVSFLLTIGSTIAVHAANTRSEVTPVQKVIELLNGMLTKGKAEKHDEQVQFAAYKQFCDDTSAEKKRAIAEANEKIDMLKADIEKYISDVAILTKEIAGHDEDIAVWTGDQKAATKVRKIEKADYEALHKDYSESVDALQRAIAVLKKQAYDRKQASSLVQVSALQGLNLIPAEAKRAINAFLQQDPAEGLAVSAPEAFGYEFQSHGIIEVLEKLLDKFIAERTTIEKEEMNTQHAYDMLMQDLAAQIEQATQDRIEKAATKAKKLEAKADAEAALADTTATRDADMKYLADLTAVCAQKAADFESRQTLRAEEIVAIEKAIEIISSNAVAGNAKTYLPALPQVHTTSFTSLRTDTSSRIQARVAEFLSDRAKQLNSRVLATISEHVADDLSTGSP